MPEPSALCPIDKGQPGHAGEFKSVGADERQAMDATNGRNLQVVRADGLAERFQIVSNVAVMTRGGIVKRQRGVSGEQSIQQGQAAFPLAVLLRSVP
jgi:hypothetical protein